jgi:hypothetical protein
MKNPSPALRELAAKLLAGGARASDPQMPETALMNKNFRVALTRLIGAAGVTSLLGRALALASAEVPELRKVKINAKGQLEKMEHLAEGTSRRAAAAAITTQMLVLLDAFIGESMTRRLVLEAISANGTDDGLEEAYR